jgi:hypothetical protein
LAIVGIGIGAVNSESRSSELWFEVAKAGLQLLAIAVLGGAVAWAFRSLDAGRDDRRRRDEYLASVANDLWDAYNRIKAVRRRLIAAGFRKRDAGLSSEPLTEEQVAELRGQMIELIDAQLMLERLARGVETQPSLYSPSGKEIGSSLRRAERYVNDAIDDWETCGRKIEAGRDMDTVKQLLERERVKRPLEQFHEFLGPAKAPRGMKVNLSNRVEDAAALIQSRRFGTEPHLGEANREGSVPPFRPDPLTLYVAELRQTYGSRRSSSAPH